MDNIVVYRSEFERQADIFWQQNPEYIFYVLVFAVVAGLILMILANSKKK